MNKLKEDMNKIKDDYGFDITFSTTKNAYTKGHYVKFRKGDLFFEGFLTEEDNLLFIFLKSMNKYIEDKYKEIESFENIQSSTLKTLIEDDVKPYFPNKKVEFVKKFCPYDGGYSSICYIEGLDEKKELACELECLLDLYKTISTKYNESIFFEDYSMFKYFEVD